MKSNSFPSRFRKWAETLFQNDWVLAGTFFIATIASRLPFRSSVLYNWDAVDFALALERFSVAEDQPHPPGYILYVAAGRIFNFFFNDANSALVAISIVGSALAVTLIFFLGRDIFDRETGMVAALLLLFSPLNWLYSEVALSYEAELPLVLAAVWLIYQLYFHHRFAVWGGIVIGVAAGLRQDVLLFLGPFWLFGTLKVRRKEMFLSWSALMIAVLSWLAPLLFFVGGTTAFREINQAQFDLIINSFQSTGLSSFSANGQKVWQAFLWLAGAAGILIIYVMSLFLTPRRLWSEKTMLFFAMLTIPALLYFFFFHFGQPGYLLVCAGSMILVIARALVLLKVDLQRLWTLDRKKRIFGSAFLLITLGVVCVINFLLFYRAPRMGLPVPPSGNSVSTLYGSYSYLWNKHTEQEVAATLGIISRFDPESTLVVSTYPFEGPGDHWRRLVYYLPEYRIVMLSMGSEQGGYHDGKNHVTKWIADETDIQVSQEITQSVFLGVGQNDTPTRLELVPFNDTDTRIYSVELPEAGSIKVGKYNLNR